MSASETINQVRGALGAHVLKLEQKSQRRVFIDIAPETVFEAGSVMFEEIGARLQIATGIDTAAGIEVMYHWALDSEDCVVTVRTTVGREAPVLESIAEMCPAAEWIEREIWELLGVEFEGHPDLRHLLLDDGWPEGNYPLRIKKFANEFAPTGTSKRNRRSEFIREKTANANARAKTKDAVGANSFAKEGQEANANSRAKTKDAVGANSFAKAKIDKEEGAP